MRNQSKGGLKKLLMVVSALSMLFTLSACSLDEYGTYENLQYDEGKSFAENTKTGGNGNVSSATAISTSAGEDISRYFPDGVIRDKKVTPKGNGEDTVTILVFMNGSNLESEDSEATTDLSEMVAAGSSEKVNIIVQTMGTKKWDKKFGIAPDRSQIYKVEGNGLTLLKDDIGQQDCTAEKTLSDFIIWGAQNYPADRYALLFWNHGGGPVYGFGYDEWNSDENAALTIDEMQSAMKRAGVYFDFVGMDCCLMSCLEVCCAFYDYCDYMVLSEDFESGLGWEYTSWLKALYKNTSMDTVELGRMICDSMVEANETQEGGDKSSMTVIDMSVLKVLYAAWTDFAYANESALLGTNFSRSTKRVLGGRTLPRLLRNDRPYGWSFDFFGLDEYGEEDEENLSMAEFFVTDIMEVANSVESEQSAALSAAINATLCYVRNTATDAGLTGIAVSLPYGDSEYYSLMKPIFNNIGLDKEYVDWLSKFTAVAKQTSTSTHDDWDDYWDGWDDYEDDYDWEDWDYEDDSYGGSWWDFFGWDDWSYEDSWNQWYEEDDWDDDCCYQGEDWYYGDDYWYEDDWYGDGSWDDDYYDDDYGWFY